MGNVLWAFVMVILFGSGIYLTVKLGFPQFNLKGLFFSSFTQKSNDGLTPLAALNIALASRIGVGSLAGVALALYLGGIGTIFWMWVSALIFSVYAFAEAILGSKYQIKQRDGFYIGGPPYYIDKGLKNKFLAFSYAVIIIIAYIIGFLTIQTNTIVKAITVIFKIEPLLIALIIISMLFIIIIKGVKGIAVATSKIVPVMSIGYILITLFIIINNSNLLSGIFINIMQSAFCFKTAISGFIPMVIIGLQRGLFSNEAGIGSGAIAAATSKVDSSVEMGFIQMIGVYFTTMIICTLTAFVIILSNYEELILLDVNGIEITQNAFYYHLGNFGNYILMVMIILFAFSTIITGYFYGECNLKYLKPGLSSRGLLFFKIIVLGLLLIGSISSPTIIWYLINTFVLLMVLINTYALIMLRHEFIAEYRNYKKRKR